MAQQLILGRYRLIERLAIGGSAEVWRAHDIQLDRPVAIKRLHPHVLPDPASRLRLAAEARAAASLSHPVIVDVYDVDSTGEAPALVMELVDGESLAARIDRDGPLSAQEAARVTADVADALYHAHQRGVIHRDVKPGNVLLGRDGRTRLVDFGIAHSLAEAAERLTMTGTVIGTLRSMAPEQLAAGPITPRTDLYGLGVVLHEALTGRPPYDSGSPLALAEQQRAGPPPVEGIDPALAALLASCLASDPALRPLHAGALAVALRAWIAGDRTVAVTAHATPMAQPADPAAVTQPIAVVPPRQPAGGGVVPPAGSVARRRPLVLLGALAAALLLTGAALMAVLRPGDDATGGAPTPSAAASVAILPESPTATPPPPVTPTQPPVAPTQPPAWLARLVERVSKDCGDEVVSEAEAAMGGMSEKEAKSYADQQVRACKDAADEDGGRGDGNGRGGDDDD